MKEWYDQKYFDGMEEYARNSAPRSTRRILKYRPESVLDVGCGHGYLVAELLKKGIAVEGVDWSDSAGTLIPNNFTKAEAKALPFPNQSFDIVVSTDFLEHIPEEEVEQVYSEMVRVAKRHVLALINFNLPEKKERDTHVTLRPKHWWIQKCRGIEFLVG